MFIYLSPYLYLCLLLVAINLRVSVDGALEHGKKKTDLQFGANVAGFFQVCDEEDERANKRSRYE
tara:strand:+ start:777 stop:971 length:195 start_codon:yes stop_codon:yes gene_type:complete